MLFFSLIALVGKKFSNGLSFARERLRKHLAHLRPPVENCVEKWQNRHICHFDLLSS